MTSSTTRRMVLLVVSFSFAIITTAHARDITAASCSRTDVVSAISNAITGDRVLVPACSSTTWSPSIPISGKNITVQGAGAGNTIISTGAFTLSGSASRITGFTFTNLAHQAMMVTASQGFRIDHNAISCPGHNWVLFIGSLDGSRSFTPSWGLVDNNVSTNCRFVVFGEFTNTGGKDRWAEPLTVGDEKAVYFEDNQHTITNCDSGNNGVLCNYVDANVGGRYVVRFNTITNSYLEFHSYQGLRAARAFEIYDNTFNLTGSFASGFSRPFLIRGGTGMIFHNTLNQNYSATVISIDNVRSQPTYSDPDPCNGADFKDGNTSGQQGWPCRDQIGRTTDASLWSTFPNAPAPSQGSQPAYFWKNTGPAGEVTWAYNGGTNQVHLQPNRDFYQSGPTFNGSSGIGAGTLAARPATCTTGVAYWATDQGEWNSREAGPDGQLYKCTAPNTWALHYLPHPYPHPLQAAAAGGSAPSSPLNLQIQ